MSVTGSVRSRAGRVAGAAALLAAGAACASPFQVDSTHPAEGLEVKSSFEWRDSDAKRTRISPKLAVAMPMSPDLEIEIATAYRRVDRDGASEGGLGDSVLELKWRLAREHGGGPAFAVIPELSLPTGDEERGLGSGRLGLVVPFVVEKCIGALMLSGELGYGRSFGGAEDYVPLGVLLTAKPRDSLKVGMELAGEAPGGRFSDSELSGNVGFKWEATPHFEIHGLLGRTVRSPDGDPTTRVKLVAEMHL